jgi:hypothetical protein
MAGLVLAIILTGIILYELHSAVVALVAYKMHKSAIVLVIIATTVCFLILVRALPDYF